jgi:hypothetical protein
MSPGSHVRYFAVLALVLAVDLVFRGISIVLGDTTYMHVRQRRQAHLRPVVPRVKASNISMTPIEI